MKDLAATVRSYLLSLQDHLCAAIEAEDGTGRFREEVWEREEGGGGRSRVLSEGAVFEQAGVGFSHVFGPGLPPSATVQRPELAGYCTACWTGEYAVPISAHDRRQAELFPIRVEER